MSAAPAADLAALLIAQEEGPSYATVYFVGGLAHIARGVCIDAAVKGAGLSQAAQDLINAEKLTWATGLAQDLPGYQRAGSVRQATMVSLCFQLGDLQGWPQFRAACALGDWQKAADALKFEDADHPEKGLSRWYQETPARARREVAMILTGLWVPQGDGGVD